MCGICGKINLGPEPVLKELLQKMAGALRHRGPDDEGFYLKGNAGLGHRRLSIIDLSQAGRQPMPNENNSLWLVCNGEIYNFQELRDSLQEKGHTFRSKSDNEVILHLYEEKGEACVKELRGMFAFALWDENKKKLLLARDRAGKKPLVYALSDSALIFASEINSLLQDNRIPRTIDKRALDSYLTYLYVPAPHSIFSAIKKLPPAHILVLEGNKVRIEEYWRLSFSLAPKKTEEDYIRELLELFTESCRIRMNSDVPLGAFLSGGIDSSAVVAMMSRFSSCPVKTFAIGFKEQSFNELNYARRISGIFSTDHHEYIVEPKALDILPELVRHFGEPFADSSAIPTYYVSKMTRQDVTVALNGDGGDELFAGYERYIANKISGIPVFPAPITRGIASFVRGLPESTAKKGFTKRLKKFINPLSLSKEARYAYWMTAFSPEEKTSLYSQELRDALGRNNPWEYIYEAYRKSGTDDFLAATLFVDSTTYLPNDLLVKVDITSMANSLEARSPFLDHKLMEFCAAIPSELKLKGFTTKYILRKALQKILPPDILNRKKHGFGVPVGSWFRDDLKSYAYDLLLSQEHINRGYFRKEALKELLDEHSRGAIDHGGRIWALVNLELWHKMFIDNE